MSFLEIYNEEIKDLLNRKKKGGAKLKVKMLKGGGNEIPGLVRNAVNSVADLDNYVRISFGFSVLLRECSQSERLHVHAG